VCVLINNDNIKHFLYNGESVLRTRAEIEQGDRERSPATDWISFQLAIIAHQLGLICCDITPVAKITS